MHASMGQYSMHAGEPAQPVQQSVVIASMRGFFLRVALPSPTDIGSCFSTMSKMLVSASAVMCETLTYPQVSLNENLKGRKPSDAQTKQLNHNRFLRCSCDVRLLTMC